LSGVGVGKKRPLIGTILGKKKKNPPKKKRKGSSVKGEKGGNKLSMQFERSPLRLSKGLKSLRGTGRSKRLLAPKEKKVPIVRADEKTPGKGALIGLDKGGSQNSSISSVAEACQKKYQRGYLFQYRRGRGENFHALKRKDHRSDNLRAGTESQGGEGGDVRRQKANGETSPKRNHRRFAKSIREK